MRTDDVGQAQLDPQTLRRAQPLNQALPTTIKWVAGLPAKVRPLSLLREFPRIANDLARAWPDAPSFAASMDSLLHDRRGGRRGFSGDVQSELRMLRCCFEVCYLNAPGVPDGDADAADWAG